MVKLNCYKILSNTKIFKRFFLKKNSPLKNLPFVSVLVKVSSCCSVSIAFFSYVDKQNLLKNNDGTFFLSEDKLYLKLKWKK